MSQANIQLAKDCYAAFQRGDLSAMSAMMTEDIDWITGGEGGLPTCGVRKGISQVMQFFELVAKTWEFQSFEPKEFIDSGDQVIVLGSYNATARSTGRQVASDWVMVWRMEHGKVAYFREYTDTWALAQAVQTKAATA